MSGLGLAIVKSRVELHRRGQRRHLHRQTRADDDGGRVSVTSEQGIGSTFVLILPTVQGARPTVPQS